MSRMVTQGTPGGMGAGAACEAEERTVSSVTGDRLCVGCGFNLTGQRVVREPRHGLLIVRCPECAMVAALQEYPALARWSARWAALLGALWCLLLLAGVGATGAFLFGMNMVTLDEGRMLYGHQIGLAYAQWESEEVAAGRMVTAATGQSGNTGAWASVSSAWWATADRAAIWRRAGGLRTVIGESAGVVWPAVVMVCFPMGCVGGVMVMRGRWKARLVLMAAPLLIAGAMVFVFVQAEAMSAGATMTYAAALATQEVWWKLVSVTLGVAALPLLAGLMLGRRVVRWLLSWMLPARLLGAFGVLWEVDGLALPRPRSSGGRNGRAG